MAIEFRREGSAIAESLDKLREFAEGWVMLENQRRIQLGRDKEARIAEAYKYLIEREDEKTSDMELAIDSVSNNLLDKGVQLDSLGKQYKTVDSKVLLEAANTGALEMLNLMLQDSKAQSESYTGYLRDAKSAERKINLFDAAISGADPSDTGKKHVVDKSDVDIAAAKFMDKYEGNMPEIMQRLETLKQPESLAQLQTEYYDKLTRDVQTRTAEVSSENMESKLKIDSLELPKQESIEAVEALTYQPVSQILEQYGAAITRQSELGEIEDIESKEYIAKQEEVFAEMERLGAILYPWAGETMAGDMAGKMQVAIVKATRDQNYNDLIQYFQEGNLQYNEMSSSAPELAEFYRNNLSQMFGIDIADDAWVNQLVTLNNLSGRIDVEQALEGMQISNSLLPGPVEEEVVVEGDPMLASFMSGILDEELAPVPDVAVKKQQAFTSLQEGLKRTKGIPKEDSGEVFGPPRPDYDPFKEVYDFPGTNEEFFKSIGRPYKK